MSRFVRFALALLASAALPAFAGEAVEPVAGADAYVAVPGSTFHADAGRTYRVVFDARHGADKPDHLVPAVNLAGSEMNTFAAHGVPRDHVRMAIVFHTTPSNDAVLDDAHYRAKYGVANPNLPVLSELRREGVELWVCGQSLLADGVPLDAVSPLVTIAEDGLVVIMTYGGDGYAQLTF